MAKLDLNSLKSKINTIKLEFNVNEIEQALINVFVEDNSLVKVVSNHDLFKSALEFPNNNLMDCIRTEIGEIDLEILTDCFEALIDTDTKTEHGVVFTPMYIVDYIVENSLNIHLDNMKSEVFSHISILDPACGTGIFLLGALNQIYSKYNFSKREIVENFLYGIDLQESNVHRCKVILALACLINNENIDFMNFNIVCCDSLKSNWNELFNLNKFDLIIGNPPYVNTHEIDKDYIKYLKQTFKTTKAGVFNIFYAFIEKAIESFDKNSVLGFIVPNNFLSIKAAEDLRGFIQKNNSLRKIIDFGSNMIFKPVRTYNCIIFLDNHIKSTFEYSVMDNSLDLTKDIKCINFHEMESDKLDKKGWKLIHNDAYVNIQKIEGQFRNIKDFIRTGIATLKDEAYIINDHDDNGYFKIVDGTKKYIENELVKVLYKVSDIKDIDDIEQSKKHIIFPYKKQNSGFEIISEDILKINYPNAYSYLTSVKSLLDTRDKGKPNPITWYAYGRTQGLNKYGKKLLFPTFSKKPKFFEENDETALFCNGYAVFENEFLSLEILQKILNSNVMEYYVNNTSYSIEGDYKCYQKKYIENFSIPLFSIDELKFLESESDKTRIDTFLFQKYDIQI